MCHDEPLKIPSLFLVAPRRLGSHRFMKCPLFRVPCAGLPRYDPTGMDVRGHVRGAMTSDLLVALSLASAAELPRVGLADRLRADDPVLFELASSLLPRARAVRAEALSIGVEAVGWSDPSFPAALLTLPDPPPALWYRGRLETIDGLVVAIVGSRAASAVAVETASNLASDLASRGITVISGLARGIDSAAHRGALETGCTAAVLGSGVDRVYPPEHDRLAAEIAVRGVVLSEYPPGMPPLKHHFPQRNRLISGLSRAVVVVEAGERSGSLITAACALDQGREVMAVPGSVLNGRNRGAHALIRDGAKIVECADDIVDELCACPAAAASSRVDVSTASSGVSLDPVLGRLEVARPYDLDEIAAATGMTGAKLLARLSDLELQGRVRRVGGARFVRAR